MSKTLARLLIGLVEAATRLRPGWRCPHTRLLVSEGLRQRHTVETRHGPITFVSTDARALEYPREFFNREPETLAWIDTMEPGSVLWDIGANVGAYSLYAARRGLRVLAFEPAANTFCALMGNIQANRLEDRVGAYCIALAERAALDALNMSRTYASSVHHAFGETVDSLGESIPIAFRQPTPGLSVDAFREIFALPAPDHIKLDVDSIEEKILRGAQNTLSDPRLKSLLMEEAETMPESNARIAAWMAARGFARRVSGRGGLKTVNVVFERAGI